MGKENLYRVCQNCPHTCTDKPCEAFLQLKVLDAAEELDLDELRDNIAYQVERVR